MEFHFLTNIFLSFKQKKKNAKNIRKTKPHISDLNKFLKFAQNSPRSRYWRRDWFTFFHSDSTHCLLCDVLPWHAACLCSWSTPPHTLSIITLFLFCFLVFFSFCRERITFRLAEEEKEITGEQRSKVTRTPSVPRETIVKFIYTSFKRVSVHI